MRRTLFKSKIHRATVTAADVDYEGSVTVDPLLLEAADIWPWERVDVWDVTNGARLSTYAIPGERGSGVVCINGAAAHRVHPGDVVILATFASMEEDEAALHRPRVVLVDGLNRIVRAEHAEVPGPSPVDTLDTLID